MTVTKKRRLLIISSAIGGILIVSRILLPWALKKEINTRLKHLNGATGEVKTIHLKLFRGIIIAKDLAIKTVGNPAENLTLDTNEITCQIAFKPLFKREIVSNLKVTEPKINIVKQLSIASKEAKPSLDELRVELRATLPFKINFLQIVNGAIKYRDETKNPNFDFTGSHINVDLENLTNSKKISDSLFAKLSLNGEVLDSGKIQVQATVNPAQKPLVFKLASKLIGLNLRKLDPWLMATKKIEVQKGTFDLIAEVRSDGNEITGYLKPLVHDLQIANFKEDKKKGLGHAIKEQVLDAAAAALKNLPQNQQATKIPFHGKLDHPKADLWATLGYTYQNIFIEALKPTF